MPAEKSKILRRLPFVVKVVLLTVISGTVVGIVSDRVADLVVNDIFEKHLQNMLEEQSQEDRLRFDHYLKDFHQVVRLTVEYRPFLEHVKKAKWDTKIDKSKIFYKKRLPAWLLNRQALSHLAAPAFVILLDRQEGVREVYSKRASNRLPKIFSDPPSLMIEKGRGQTHVYSSQSGPYAITAEDFFIESNRKGTLLIVSPIDDEFLMGTQKDMPGRLIGLVNIEENTLMASNNSLLLPKNVSLEKIGEDFVITGREYHDYGGAEMAIRISSFVPKKEVVSMSQSFLDSERKKRLVTAFIYLIVFILIILWITERIKLLTYKVESFSRKALGGNNPQLPPGDQLDILAERFQILKEEVLASHRTIKEKAKEDANRELLYETKSRQLIILELIMESLGFGVLIREGKDYRPVNNKMLGYLEKYTDLSNFIVTPPESVSRRIKDDNGSESIFQLTGLELFEDNEVIVVNDISESIALSEEREQLKNSLHQAMKMESIGRLAGGVAHDFNNLLTTILGYSQLGIMYSTKEDPKKVHFENIFEAGKKASDLTQQLLSFSRKDKVRPKIIDLNIILEDLHKMFGRLIGEDIKVEVVAGSGLWKTLIDRTQAEQILMNLAINAKDAMPKGGQLLFETANVEISESSSRDHHNMDPGKYVKISVTDNGQGMSREIVDHIFEPFFTTKDIGRGTGLGLFMIYGIVEQSKGKIFVQSEKGKGSTFEIYLPACDEDKNEKHERPSSEDYLARGKETILLVEDERQVLMLIKGVLTSLGYKIHTTDNAAEAEELIAEGHEKVDLLFTDIVMPKISGVELADRISKISPAIKILFMTGYTDKEITNKLELDDNANLLHKPLTPASIARKVREVLDK